MSEDTSERKLATKIIEFYKNLWEKRDYTDENPPPVFPEKILRKLFRYTKNVMKKQGPFLSLHHQCVVVGDLHGSLFDLFRIFRVFGTPPDTRFLFLGDYVDRGQYSIQVISILFAFVILYPSHIYLLRGNHEFPYLNKVYGFYDEVINVFTNDTIWCKAQEVFCYMPLAATIKKQIFCVHGGLSPLLKTLQDIKDIKYPLLDYNSNDLVRDIVWADPDDSANSDPTGFIENPRGTGVLYGTHAIKEFCEKNKIKLILRAHQCVSNGIYSFGLTVGATVFSCTNYGGVSHNKSGALKIYRNLTLDFYSFGLDFNSDKSDNATMLLNENKPGIHQIEIEEHNGQQLIKSDTDPEFKLINQNLKLIPQFLLDAMKEKEKNVTPVAPKKDSDEE